MLHSREHSHVSCCVPPVCVRSFLSTLQYMSRLVLVTLLIAASQESLKTHKGMRQDFWSRWTCKHGKHKQSAVLVIFLDTQNCPPVHGTARESRT